MRNCSRVSCAMAAWQYWMTEDHEDRTCLLLSSLFSVRWATVEISFRSSATASPTPLTSVSSVGGAPKTPRKRTETLDQRLGDRLGVAPRDQAEKQQLEDFVVGKRSVAELAEAVTQPLAMAVIMLLAGKRGGQGRPGIRRGRLLRLTCKERTFVGGNRLLRLERQLVVGGYRNGALRHRIVTRCGKAGRGGRGHPATA